MLNFKLHVTICHETFLFVLSLKDYKNDEDLKKNFKIAQMLRIIAM